MYRSPSWQRCATSAVRKIFPPSFCVPEWLQASVSPRSPASLQRSPWSFHEFPRARELFTCFCVARKLPAHFFAFSAAVRFLCRGFAGHPRDGRRTTVSPRPRCTVAPVSTETAMAAAVVAAPQQGLRARGNGRGIELEARGTA